MNPSFATQAPPSTPFNIVGMRGNILSRSQAPVSAAAFPLRGPQLSAQPTSRQQVSTHHSTFNNVNSGASSSSSGGVVAATQVQPPQQTQTMTQIADPLQGAKKSVEDYYKRQAASEAELQSFVRVDHKAKVNSLEHENREICKTNKALREEHARLNQLIANEKSNWQQLNVGMLEVRARSHATLEELRRMVEWKNQAVNDQNSLKNDLEGLKSRFAELSNIADRSKEAAAQYRRERDAISEELASCKSQLEEIRLQLSAAQSVSQQRESDLQTISERLQSVEEELMNERHYRQHAESVVQAKSREISDLNSRLDEAATQKQEMKLFIESLQTESREKEIALSESLMQARSHADSIRSQLEESKTRQQETLKQLCATIEDSERNKSEHSASVQRFEDNIATLSDKSARLEQEFLKACEALNDARNQKDHVSSQLEQLAHQMNQKQQEFEAAFIAKESEINDAVNEKNRALEEVNNKDAELQRLRSEFEDTVNELRAEINSRDKHVAYMSKSLNDMTAQLNGLQKIAESNPYQSRPSTLLDVNFTGNAQRRHTQAPKTVPVDADDNDSMPPPPPKTPAPRAKPAATKPTATKPASSSSHKSNDSINLTAYTKVLSKQQESKAAPKTRGRAGKTASKKEVDLSVSDDDVFSFK